MEEHKKREFDSSRFMKVTDLQTNIIKRSQVSPLLVTAEMGLEDQLETKLQDVLFHFGILI